MREKIEVTLDIPKLIEQAMIINFDMNHTSNLKWSFVQVLSRCRYIALQNKNKEQILTFKTAIVIS